MKTIIQAFMGMAFSMMPFEATAFDFSQEKTESNQENATFPNVNKYYRLRSGRGFYLTVSRTNASTVNVKGLTLDNNNAAQIWSFTASEEGKYKLTAQNRSLKTPPDPAGGKGQMVVATDEDKIGAGDFVISQNAQSKYIIGATDGETKDKLHETDSHDIVGWGKYPIGSQWDIIEATSIEVTVSAAQYATINYPFAVSLPEGLKAYTGKAEKSGERNVFVLNEVPDDIVPANTPVVLQGEAKTYTLTINDKNTQGISSITENDLSGIYLNQAIASDKEAFILGQKNEGVGFYKMNTTDRNLASNKAYLLGEKLQPGVANANAFVFSFSDNSGETTGIEESVAETATEEYFDLQGRRVMNPTKGIFLTKSGKKVLFY